MHYPWEAEWDIDFPPAFLDVLVTLKKRDLMASSKVQNTINGEGSLAAMLEKQHDEAHQATVEDAVDEYDIQHPAPSSSEKEQKKPEAFPPPPQQEQQQHQAPAPAPAPVPRATPPEKKSPVLDVHSEESFPALGSGPKPKPASPAAPTTWGASKPSLAAAVANGVAIGSQRCMYTNQIYVSLS